MICGYSRTGKDTFYNKLNQESTNLFYWKIYKKPDTSPLINWLNTSCFSYKRIAFADSLKKDIKEIYGIEVTEYNKDIIINELGITPRDLCIKHSNQMKEKDINFWCKLAIDNLNNDCYAITDFRYEHEYEYVKSKFDDVKTVRLYRSNVIEADLNVDSEHSLDSFQTDYVGVKNDDEFLIMIGKFPQYKEYVFGYEYV